MRYAKAALALPVLLGLSASQAHAGSNLNDIYTTVDSSDSLMSGSVTSLSSPMQSPLTISANFDSSITGDANAATIESTINQAIHVYETDFTTSTSAPINVSIDFGEMSSGLGMSNTTYYYGGTGLSYSNYRAALVNAAVGANKAQILANLPNQTANPVPGNSTAGVAATSANLRALGYNAPGLISVGGVNYDSQITLNTSSTNLSPTGPQNSGKYSLFATASHEIDEALGLYSALDNTGNGSANPTVLTTSNTFGTNVGSLDFFRYSANGVRSFTNSKTAVSYFSVNGGATPIVYFNDNGTGDFHDFASRSGQASPGASESAPYVGAPEVQDAYATPGANPTLGTAEITALGDVGYNITSSASPAPEPSQVGMMALMGLSLGGLLLRARKRRSQETA